MMDFETFFKDFPGLVAEMKEVERKAAIVKHAYAMADRLQKKSR